MARKFSLQNNKTMIKQEPLATVDMKATLARHEGAHFNLTPKRQRQRQA